MIQVLLNLLFQSSQYDKISGVYVGPSRVFEIDTDLGKIISLSIISSYFNLCLDYLHHEHDLGPLSTSAPPKCSPLHVDPVSGVYIGMDEEELQLYTSHHDLQFSLKSLHISSEESLSRICEDRKLSSPAVKNIKKKLLTIKSWPNLIRKPAKQMQ